MPPQDEFVDLRCLTSAEDTGTCLAVAKGVKGDEKAAQLIILQETPLTWGHLSWTACVAMPHQNKRALSSELSQKRHLCRFHRHSCIKDLAVQAVSELARSWISRSRLAMACSP